jgi:hypothetical protein
MSIEQQVKIAELERRVEQLEKLVALLTARKTLTLPKQGKAN